MRYCSRRRAGFAQPLLVALFPIALVAPAAEAQRVPVTGYHSTGDGTSAASPWRNPGGGDAGNSAGPPWHRRLPPYEGRRGAPGFGGGANWLPGAAGALGLLPALGGGNSWPSWEQMPVRSEGGPSAPDYRSYPGSASPSYPPGQPDQPGPAWQPRPEPGVSPEADGTPASGNAGSPTRPPSRTGYPPGKVSVGGSSSSRPIVHPPRKPPAPPLQQVADTAAHQAPPPAAGAVPDGPPAVPPATAAVAPPPEPPPVASTTPQPPPDPPPPVSTPPLQPPVRAALDVTSVIAPLSALLAVALLALPLRLLARALHRRWRRRTARVVLFGDRGTSRMVLDKAGSEPAAITLRLSTRPPVTTMRPAA